MHRFYAPAMTRDARRVVLDGVESAHLSRVLRLRAGASVRAFDGKGTERHALVVSSHPTASELELLDEASTQVEPRVRVVLAVGLLKSDKFDAMLRDAVMLGASAVVPLLTERCDVPASAVAGGARLDRWHRVAVASAKQSGRAVVPLVGEPVRLETCLDLDRSPLRVLFAEPSVACAERLDRSSPGPTDATQALVLIGPEGGWTPDEVDLARARGCRIVSLGSRTLRADAAPLVGLAVLQFLWGDL